jgi:hypothetical protein
MCLIKHHPIKTWQSVGTLQLQHQIKVTGKLNTPATLFFLGKKAPSNH